MRSITINVKLYTVIMRDIATQNIFTTVIKIFTANAKAINMFYVAQKKIST